MQREFSYDQERYFKFEELTEILRELASAYPDLVKLYAIGQSLQGRSIWMLEITGPGREAGAKAGYYIDANTHPEEVAGTQVALYTAWHLAKEYGRTEEITRLLDRVVFYIVPRLNPDGAEMVLTDTFYEWIGNGRYRPGEEQLDRPGLHYADVNGDGLILDMRWPDPTGEWKVSSSDPRLLVQRDLDDVEGPFYRLVPEGVIRDFDGATIPIPRPEDGNLNRNYPGDWAPESQQYGAGQYPMSEPEIRAVTEFFAAHPNVAGVLNYHTNAGVLLPPFSIEGERLPWQDQELYQRIGDLGARLTGYGFVADEAQFNFRGASRRRGTSEAFLYGHLGIICMVTELWDVHKEAGIEKDWYYPLGEISEDDNLKLLAWNDRALAGAAFVDWQPYDHPQLGRVEIGGWKRIFMFRNPPAHLLPELCHKNMLFSIKHGALSPELILRNAKAERLGDDLYRVSVVVENHGFLPTHLTFQALEIQAIPTVKARLRILGGGEVIDPAERDLGHLGGWGERAEHYSRFKDWGQSACRAEWLVRRVGQSPLAAHISVVSQKGGTLQRELVIDD